MATAMAMAYQYINKNQDNSPIYIQWQVHGYRWTNGSDIAENFNINKYQRKARLFLCFFDPDGGLVANAPYVPVHLGAMSSTVQWQLKYWGHNLNDLMYLIVTNIGFGII